MALIEGNVMAIERLRLSLRCDSCGAVFHSDAEDSTRLRLDAAGSGWRYATMAKHKTKEVTMVGRGTQTRKVQSRRHWDGCPDCEAPKTFDEFPVGQQVRAW